MRQRVNHLKMLQELKREQKKMKWMHCMKDSTCARSTMSHICHAVTDVNMDNIPSNIMMMNLTNLWPLYVLSLGNITVVPYISAVALCDTTRAPFEEHVITCAEVCPVPPTRAWSYCETITVGRISDFYGAVSLCVDYGRTPRSTVSGKGKYLVVVTRVFLAERAGHRAVPMIYVHVTAVATRGSDSEKTISLSVFWLRTSEAHVKVTTVKFQRTKQVSSDSSEGGIQSRTFGEDFSTSAFNC
uniref:Phlebovirus_G2 domain-containing protein n=1 Tax=Steinernema glaseri TaxID=37863 RepID=A0A1I8AWU8_9BILA